MIAKLHFITQESSQYTHLQAITNACEAGVRWIQLRIKDKSAKYILTIAKEAKEICDRYGARLIINDYPVIAKEVEAHGVHLGKEDMPFEEARKIVGHDMIIGATANTLEDVLHHAKHKADYIGLGPFRFTATKKNLSPILGLEGYRKIINECVKAGIDVPIIAIGGIEEADVSSLMNTGIHGIAMSSSIITSTNIHTTVKNIDSLLKATEYANHSR